MYLQCILHVFTMYLQCILHVFTMYLQCIRDPRAHSQGESHPRTVFGGGGFGGGGGGEGCTHGLLIGANDSARAGPTDAIRVRDDSIIMGGRGGGGRVRHGSRVVTIAVTVATVWVQIRTCKLRANTFLYI